MDLLSIAGTAHLSGTMTVAPIQLRKGLTGRVLGLESGFADLARIPSGSVEAYDAALDRLSGSDLAAIPDLVWRVTPAPSLGKDACDASDPQTVVTEAGCLSIGWSGGRVDHDGTGEVDGFRWDGRVFRIAGQARLDPEGRVGWAVGYLCADAGFDSGASSADGGAVLAQAGLQRVRGDWTMEGLPGFAVDEFDTRRSIGSAKAKASPEIGSVGFRLRAAYERQFRSFYVQPVLEVDAAYVRMSGFTEDGSSPLNLKVRASEALALGVYEGAETGILARPSGPGR